MKVYAISDLHGRYDIWQAAKKYLQPEDYLYCLGDNIDRGPHGIQIFDDMRRRHRTTILMGNHEEMCITDWIDEEHEPTDSIWYNNGGHTTFKELSKKGIYAKSEILLMSKLPYSATYINKQHQKIILSHAGFSPDGTGTDIRYRYFNQDHDVWNRRHLMYDWPTDPQYQDTIIIHGHTPVQALSYFFVYHPEEDIEFMNDNPEVIPKIVKYCDGHKIDIDLCANQTGWSCLLDLDTLKPTYIHGTKYINITS